MNTEASSSKVSFEESLGTNVVNAKRCLGCGACVIACPFTCLKYSDGKPKLVKECKLCGICPKVCPQYSSSLEDLDRFVFGRTRRPDEKFGIYQKLAAAQVADSKVLDASQDGGLVTGLLLFCLKNDLINGAVVSEPSTEKRMFSVPKLATTAEEILGSAGTRYFYSPNILALAEVSKIKKGKIVFVGTPCQVRAIRRMQIAGLKKYTESIEFIIGLMCSECFTYEGLVERHFQQTLGLDPNKIRKVNIKGKMLATTDLGTQAIPLKDIKQYVRVNCKSCSDFSSELADISAGGLGMDRATFTITRTQKGEELFSKAEKAGVLLVKDMKDETAALDLLRKLSARKREQPVS